MDSATLSSAAFIVQFVLSSKIRFITKIQMPRSLHRGCNVYRGFSRDFIPSS